MQLLPDTLALARNQRGHNAVGQHDCSHLISHPAGQIDGIVGAQARDIHQSGAGLRHVIERGLTTVGTVGSVTGRIRVNDLRIARAKIAVAEAEPLRHAFAEILHEDIALFSEFVHNFTGLRLGQIERDTVFVPVIGLVVIICAAFGSG